MTERFSPQLMNRDDKIHLAMRRDPTVSTYSVGIANTLDNAFGAASGGTGTTPLFTFLRGQDYISKSVQRARTVVNYSRKEADSAFFTLDEFYNPAITQSVRDDQTCYLTVTRTFFGGGTDTSPILIVPPRQFFGFNSPTITLTGNAPQLAYTAGNPVPEYGSMYFQVPLQARNVVLRNLSTTSTDTLYVAYSDFAAIPIGGGSEYSFRPQNTSDVYLFGSVKTPFSLSMSVTLGRP